MGRAVGVIDQPFHRGTRRRAKGVVSFAGLVAAAIALGLAIAALPYAWIVETVLAAMLLAQRSLVDHVRAVATGLKSSLADGRLAVSHIVGRDTTEMSESDVARAAIESGAENLSDGVIAPAFWFLIAGLPGLLAYKLTNTADSMIGYRTPRHEAFGWAAARFDDLINWVPARLTAGLIWMAYGGAGRWPEILADARRHRSPNAGWPEAAAARALGVALSGPRRYDGQIRDYPFVNAKGARQIGAAEITASVHLLWRAWLAALLIVSGALALSFA